MASRSNNRIQYNYNKIAEDFVKKYNVARREKETAIELLELHDPPEKRALPVGGKQKNKRANASPRDLKSSNQFGLGKSASMKVFRIKSRSDVKIEFSDPVVRARKRVPGAEIFWRNYQIDPKKYADLFQHVHELHTVISNSKQDHGLTDKTQDGIVISKLLKDEQDLKCQFGPRKLIFRNVQPIEGVITHGLHSMGEAYQTITVDHLFTQHVEITNTELPQTMLQFIIKSLFECSSPVQSLTIRHQEVSDDTCVYIADMLAKSGTLTHLCVNSAKLSTVGLSKLLMGALEGRILHTLEVRDNKLGK